MLAFLLAFLAAADRDAEKIARLRDLLQDRKLKKYVRRVVDQYFLENGVYPDILRDGRLVKDLKREAKLLSNRLARLRDLADDVSEQRKRL